MGNGKVDRHPGKQCFNVCTNPGISADVSLCGEPWRRFTVRRVVSSLQSCFQHTLVCYQSDYLSQIMVAVSDQCCLQWICLQLIRVFPEMGRETGFLLIISRLLLVSFYAQVYSNRSLCWWRLDIHMCVCVCWMPLNAIICTDFVLFYSKIRIKWMLSFVWCELHLTCYK